MQTGIIITCKRVLGEITNVTPPLAAWRECIVNGCKGRAINEEDGDIQAIFSRIAPLAVKHGPLSKKLSPVDLFVLSAAEARSLNLVASDGPMRTACRDGYVVAQHMNATAFFRAMGWSFG